MSLIFALLLLFTKTNFAGAAPTLSHVSLMGHNLTPTTYVLSKNQFTVGNYAVGYGITDHLMIATSPWIDIDYNMPMLDLKYADSVSENMRLSGELFYFKTFPYGRNAYNMEAWMGRLGASYLFNDHFTLHTVLAYTYFINDTAPFSLRLDSGNDHRYTLSLGTLFEVSLTDHFGLLQEFGVLGVNYYNSYFHWGSSAFWKWESSYLQVGFSQSSTVKKIGTDLQGRTVYTDEHVWHPEIQLQFFFN